MLDKYYFLLLKIIPHSFCKRSKVTTINTFPILFYRKLKPRSTKLVRVFNFEHPRAPSKRSTTYLLKIE